MASGANPICPDGVRPLEILQITLDPTVSHLDGVEDPFFVSHSLPTVRSHLNGEDYMMEGMNTLQGRLPIVSGLLDDVKPREIHNLVQGRHGFESFQLKCTETGTGR
ncbi:hypothetical protein QJS10_CPB15g00823 [Acorus calamus]|uniref:Uncharacterized protein n=1 Tax=Acorus calamus TaxID=4465 RepID=A0AAV9DAP3_ACOCL|nr:hypothetical protein QJS10_CPB15g00823 [Acorus calamus]